jgi:trk system potassium uptake protein TrkH
MNLLLAARLLGWLLVTLGAFGLVPIVAAILYREPLGPYLAAAAVPVLVGLPVALGIRPRSLRVRPRDGFLMVSSAWIVASLFGALPYLTTGVLGPVDALFESVSGFTTTGATVLPFIDGQPRPLLLWRSLTQWLGGMGIVVFAVALMPLLGIGGMSLFRAEMAGPVSEKLRPRVAATARRLWFIYVGLTSAQWLALMAAGMSPFEALCHSFSTLSTGGFSPRDASLGAYDSDAIQWIVILFMFLGGVNFVVHYRVLTGRPREVLRDSELRYYAGLTLAAALAFLWIVWRSGLYDGDFVRIASFQAVSLLTGTGFATVHFERWPALGQLIILQLMLLGAMAGSTCGGLKSLRVLLGLRALQASISLVGHRNAVRSGVRFGGKLVPSEVLAGVWTFFAAYFLLVAAAAAVVAGSGYDLVTSISSGIAAVGNVGPALGAAGPYDGYAAFPPQAKGMLALCMIAGRLELFTLLVLFSPSFWRR